VYKLLLLLQVTIMKIPARTILHECFEFEST